MIWTLARAKNQLSQLVRKATQDGPQTISVRGQEKAVVIAKAEYDRLRPGKPKPDFKAFLLSVPSLEGVELSRDQPPAGDFEL